MPEEEFLFLVQASDMFEVVKLDKEFVAKYKDQFAKNPIISDDIVERIEEGYELAEIEALIKDDHAEPLYFENKLVGCVKPAHDIDVNLSSHVMHENLMSKASSVLALLYGVRNAGIDKADVEYVIDCAEEACGEDGITVLDAEGQEMTFDSLTEALQEADDSVADSGIATQSTANPNLVVVLDPGHGGLDSGAVGKKGWHARVERERFDAQDCILLQRKT